MTFDDPEPITYRAATLEELLPQIRDELGPDAVIVRQREGIVGGIGGFFGKKCVEVEARPARRGPPAPMRAAVDAYDSGDEPDEPTAAHDEPDDEGNNVLFETL